MEILKSKVTIKLVFFQKYNKFTQDTLTALDEEILKANKYYDQLKNDVQTRPLNSDEAPYCNVTVRLGRHKIADILEAITDCLFVPFKEVKDVESFYQIII